MTRFIGFRIGSIRCRWGMLGFCELCELALERWLSDCVQVALVGRWAHFWTPFPDIQFRIVQCMFFAGTVS